jgi:hypothetical protein
MSWGFAGYDVNKLTIAQAYYLVQYNNGVGWKKK